MRVLLAVFLLAGVVLQAGADSDIICSTVVFDGTDDCILVDASPSLDLQTVTIEVVLRLFSHEGQQVFVGSYGENAGLSDAFSLWTEYGYLCSEIFGTQGQAALRATECTIPLNQWVHLAATYDGQVLKCYVEDACVDSLVSPGSLRVAPDWPITIGIDLDPSGGFHDTMDGELDEVRIWRVALPPSELGIELTGTPPADLVGWWRFVEEDTAQVVRDSTPYGNDGYLGEFPSIDVRDPARSQCSGASPAEPWSWGSLKNLWRE